MANKYSITRHVEGADDLARALAGMAAAAQTAVITEGVVAAVQPIRAVQVAICPVRTDRAGISPKKLQPREMKASIRAKVVSYPEQAKAVGLVGPSGRAKKVTHLVEFGHLVVAPVKGKTIRRGNAREAKNGVTHVPPNPFIRPSVYNTLSAQGRAFRAAAGAAYLKSVKSS